MKYNEKVTALIHELEDDFAAVRKEYVDAMAAERGMLTTELSNAYTHAEAVHQNKIAALKTLLRNW